MTSKAAKANAAQTADTVDKAFQALMHAACELDAIAAALGKMGKPTSRVRAVEKSVRAATLDLQESLGWPDC